MLAMTTRPPRPPSDDTRAAGTRPHGEPAAGSDGAGAGADAGAVRVAGVTLRGRDGRVPARAYWPSPPGPGPAPALLVLFPADREPAGLDAADPLCRRLCAGAGLVVLSVSHRAAGDATTATEWAADHAAELDAHPRRLLVGGVGTGGRVAAAVARDARDDGWPPVERQVLILPELGGDGAPPAAGNTAGLAPATVVTVDGGDGQRYAARLRRTGVDVDELRYGEPPEPDRLTGDLARALGPASTEPTIPLATPPADRGAGLSVSP